MKVVIASALVSALLLSACSQKEAPAPQPTALSVPAGVKSQWLLVAHTDAKGGGIYVDPTLKRLDAATGLSDVTLKVVHGDLSALDANGEDGATNPYRDEQVTFRFNCANKTYALVKREALNKTGDVIATTADPITDASYREVAPGGVAGVALSQACVVK